MTTTTDNGQGFEWCNGPLRTVRLDGQTYKGTCVCGRHDTRASDRTGAFAQAHIPATSKEQ